MRQRLVGVGGLAHVSAVLLLGSLLSAETPLARMQGQPKFKDGKALGYFVWKDGDTWKLRWKISSRTNIRSS